MSLQLKLLPEFKKGWGCAWDILQLSFDDVLFAKIISLERRNGIAIKKPIETYVSSNSAFHDSVYGLTQKTPYGDTIKGVKAGDLKKLDKNYIHLKWRNSACFGFIQNIPDDQMVWLFWY